MNTFKTLPAVGARNISRRIGQREILPVSVSNRLLGNIVLKTGTSQGTISLDDGEDVLFVTTTSSRNNERNLTVVDVSVYIGSVAAANQLPGGSSIDESEWEIVLGSGNDWGLTDNFNTVTIAYIRNISAGASQNVILNTQSRSIVNTTVS